MQQTGFTLFELLIVLAIMSILIGLTYPSYRHHLIKAHRLNTRLTLLNIANRLEDYYSVHHEYSGASLSTLGFSSQTEDHAYELVLEVDDSHYLIEVKPLHTQTQDTLCATFSLDDKGNKKISGSGTLEECW